jgi:hypothetical protein
MGDDRCADRRIGIDIGCVDEPLPHADDVARRGARAGERVIDVAPRLGRPSLTPSGTVPSGRKPGVPEV